MDLAATLRRSETRIRSRLRFGGFLLLVDAAHQPRSSLTDGLRGTPGRIRTCGLLLRRQALYPAELRARAMRLHHTARIRRLSSNIRTAGSAGGSDRYGDLNVMLVRWQHSIPVRQRFQHGGQMALRDHFGPGLTGPAGAESGAFRAPHRKWSCRIADSMRTHRLRQRSRHRPRAVLASALRTRFRIASAAAELGRAMSKGAAPASEGCGRFTPVSMASRSPS